MKKIYTLFLVIAFLGSYKSQETLPFYQQYLMEGDFLFNPALYGKTSPDGSKHPPPPGTT